MLSAIRYPASSKIRGLSLCEQMYIYFNTEITFGLGYTLSAGKSLSDSHQAVLFPFMLALRMKRIAYILKMLA